MSINRRAPQTGLDVFSLRETTTSCCRSSCTYKHATGMFALRRSPRVRALILGKQKERADHKVCSFFWRPKQGSTCFRLCDTSVRNIVVSLAWSASRYSLFLPVRQFRFICHRQRETANQLTAAVLRTRPLTTPPRVRAPVGHKKERVAVATLSFLAPQTGLEPVTPRLTAACSTD